MSACPSRICPAYVLCTHIPDAKAHSGIQRHMPAYVGTYARICPAHAKPHMTYARTCRAHDKRTELIMTAGYIHTYITYIHTYVRTYVHTYMHTYIACIHACMIYMHCIALHCIASRHIHTYMHAYIHDTHARAHKHTRTHIYQV